MVIYAIGIAAFLYWLATRWATRRAPHPPRGAGFWVLLSNASFGIYLIHAYILEQAMVYLVPNPASAAAGAARSRSPGRWWRA